MKVQTFISLCLAILLLGGCTNDQPGASKSERQETESQESSSHSATSSEGEDSTSLSENPAQTDDNKPANSLLDGNWKVDRIEVGGESQQPEPGMPDSIEISDGLFNASSEGSQIGTFSQLNITIELDTNPKELNLVRQKDGREETLPCIFRLIDDRLEIAMPLAPTIDSPDQLQRPTSFDTSLGPFLVLSAERSE